MKIVLLNPPGDKLYVRSYYCGATSKSSYIFQPIDLLMLSGTLQKEHEIIILDCIVEKIGQKEAISNIIASQADAVICVVSAVSWKSDLEFLHKLKSQIPLIKIIANGDVLFDDPEQILKENSCIDAIIFDFISSDILHYLNDSDAGICNMVYKKGDRVITKRDVSGGKTDSIFTIPIPRHELFLSRNYRFPFARSYPFATVLMSFGCPFKCSFCIANVLGFKYRKAEDVIEELSYIAKLGIKELFFEDMSFGIPKDNALDLCGMIVKKNMKFSWTCFSRVDLIDRQILSAMKDAGCHTIMFGVESADEKILRAHNKGYVISKVSDAFNLCRELDMKTVATFILGLPGETKESCLKTISFAKDLGCDYASFNIAVPRHGTQLRRIAIEAGLIRSDHADFDHSGQTVSMPSKHLSKNDLMVLRKKAIREFYLRPSYILKRIRSIGSFTELKEHTLNFCGLLIDAIRPK